MKEIGESAEGPGFIRYFFTVPLTRSSTEQWLHSSLFSEVNESSFSGSPDRAGRLRRHQESPAALEDLRTEYR
jgi:hypothetical protein